MKIKSLQSVLCLAMLAILTEQQASQAEQPASVETPTQTLFAYNSSFWAYLRDPLFGYPVIPTDVPVELTPVDPSAWAHATINSTVTLQVVDDVIVGQYAYAYRGTLIEAKVTRLREGKLRIRGGRVEPRVMEVNVPWVIPTTPSGSLKLRLESTPRSRISRTAKKLITSPLTAIHIVVIVPAEYVLLMIACSTGCDL